MAHIEYDGSTWYSADFVESLEARIEQLEREREELRERLEVAEREAKEHFRNYQSLGEDMREQMEKNERLRAKRKAADQHDCMYIEEELAWARARIEAALAIPEPELDPYGDGPIEGGGTDFISGWRAHQRATVGALKGEGEKPGLRWLNAEAQYGPVDEGEEEIEPCPECGGNPGTCGHWPKGTVKGEGEKRKRKRKRKRCSTCGLFHYSGDIPCEEE